MNIDQDAYLEHFGVKGMKWGQRRDRLTDTSPRLGNRNNKRVQKRLNRMKRVATGKATTLDKLTNAAFDLNIYDLMNEGSVKGANAAMLDRGARLQGRIISGKSKTTDLLTRMSGIDIKQLDYNYGD